MTSHSKISILYKIKTNDVHCRSDYPNIRHHHSRDTLSNK